MNDDLLPTLINLALLSLHVYAALLLVLAGWAKLRDPADSLRTISAYRLLPGALEVPAARTLPILEIATGLGLLLPSVAAGSGLLAAALFLLFAAAIGINLSRGRRTLDCGCGLGRRRIGPGLLLHNLGLAVLLSASAGQAVTLSFAAILFAIMCAGAVLALILCLETLASARTIAN